MPDAHLERRVAILEENMKQFADVPAKLDALGARVAVVESQIVQLRDEMRGEFSSIRTEMHALGGTLRTEMRDLEGGLRTEMRTLNEETRTALQVLHEDVIARIALLREAPGHHPRSATGRARRKKR